MYITSFCSISPAGVLAPGTAGNTLAQPAPGKAGCIEPDYKELIPPMQLRRMTKPVRTGVAAARLCLQAAGSPMPDAIHAGTAYGMLQDSEHFLQKMIDQEEQMLNPTAFIQSTHNTVAGQIALSLGCNAHNMTYVHRGHSFESALTDALLMLEDYPQYTVLAGAVDECTDTSYALLQRFGVYNASDIAGEGAAFFALSATAGEGTIARLTAFDMFTGREGLPQDRVTAFLAHHRLTISPGDELLCGISGFSLTGSPWEACRTVIDYKQYCGEYPTASSFALALTSARFVQGSNNRCWILNQFGPYYSIWCIDPYRK